MPSLKDIRKRIGSVKNTQQITKAMKMVAAVKLRKAQESIEAKRPYAYRLRDVIGDLAARSDFSEHPLLAQREPKRIALLVMTSDRGLCGGFNNGVCRTTERYIKANELGHEAMEVDVVGRKGLEYFKRRPVTMGPYFKDVLTDLSVEKAREIAEHCQERFLENDLDAVYVVYNEFKSAIAQEVIVEQLLPVVPAESSEGRDLVEFLYEPTKQDLMDAVLPRHLTIQVWRMMLESVASEMGARMTAMDAATKNAGEMIDALTLQYNRARQSMITTELMEIIGGSEALKG